MTQADPLFDKIIQQHAKTWHFLWLVDKKDPKKNLPRQGKISLLSKEEASAAIENLRANLAAKGEASDLFGREKKAGEMAGILASVEQTFDGEELLPSLEEKAANLFYRLVKNHPFVDGNKRIGTLLFLLFLEKNKISYPGELSQVALQIARSAPAWREEIISGLVSFLRAFGESSK